jgi:predicted Zn-dependent peptidase
MADPDYEIHTFDNGIRLIHKHVTHSRIAHLGFFLDIGSRDEQPGEEGLAHFWEHMAFKGTENRKAFHILNRLETVGGELNAYTTKEKIAFHASLLDSHFKMAADLLTDITFRSTFPAKEIEKERQVILEEMSMYKDTPDEAIFDELDAQVFAGHALGANILGQQDTVKNFGRDAFFGFIGRNLATERVVFSSVANIPFKKIIRQLEPLIAALPAKTQSGHRRLPPGLLPPTLHQEPRPGAQTHTVWGRQAPGLHNPARLPFFMLINILGGPGANSRLNLALRERHGLVYGVDSGYTPFTDSGQCSIYFATDPGQVEKATQLVLKELKKLRDVPLGTLQLHQAKEQLMGQLAMAEESNAGLMQVLGKGLLDSGRIESLPELFGQIKAVTAAQLQDLANQWLVPDAFSKVIYTATEQ